LFIIAALAGVSYWAIQQKQKQNAEQVVPAPAVTESPGAGEDSRAATSPAPTATQDSLVPTDGSLRMIVELVDDAYVDLDVDGKSVFKDVMKSGERHVFNAQEQFRFRTVGNAAGLALTLNGVKLPALGRDGQVVKNRIFDQEYLVTLNQNTEGSGE
jgi:hypothetical protein